MTAAHETEFSPGLEYESGVEANTSSGAIGLKRLAEPELGGPVERSRCKSAGLF